jgi:PAS domain-containing protein
MGGVTTDTTPAPLPTTGSDLFGEYGTAVSCASAVILLAVIASIDKLTGFDLRLSILYLLPVAIVTWAAGRNWGLAMSVLGVSTWLALFWSSNPYTSRMLYYWDGAVSLMTLVVFTLLLARLRDELRASDKRFVKVLENLDAAVCVLDPERREVLYGNKHFLETLSREPYEALARRSARETRLRWPDGRRVLLRIVAER